MPKMNGEMRAAERRALAYRNEPIAGGVKVRIKAACCFHLFTSKAAMEELESLRRVTGGASVSELVMVLCRQAMGDPVKVQEALQRERERQSMERERQRIRAELERAKLLGVDLPIEI